MSESPTIRLDGGRSGVPYCLATMNPDDLRACPWDCWDGRFHAHCSGGPQPHMHDLDDPALILAQYPVNG